MSFANNANAHLVDALPYIDLGYDETAKLSALALIEDECKRFRPSKDYLAHLPAPVSNSVFETELMKAEFERIGQRQPMDKLNMKRYELPGPSHGRMTDVNAWKESVDNARAQLEHQSMRMANLELLEEYAPEQFKLHLNTLQLVMQQVQKEVGENKQQLQNVNIDRKRAQLDAGQQLKTLEEQWVTLVTKNYEIENAILQLETQTEPLRKKYKQSEE